MVKLVPLDVPLGAFAVLRWVDYMAIFGLACRACEDHPELDATLDEANGLEDVLDPQGVSILDARQRS